MLGIMKRRQYLSMFSSVGKTELGLSCDVFIWPDPPFSLNTHRPPSHAIPPSSPCTPPLLHKCNFECNRALQWMALLNGPRWHNLSGKIGFFWADMQIFGQDWWKNGNFSPALKFFWHPPNKLIHSKGNLTIFLFSSRDKFHGQIVLFDACHRRISRSNKSQYI